MSPRYVIHAGPLKTASTYLQRCMLTSQQDLLRQGVCYPSELLSTKNEHVHTPVVRMVVNNDMPKLRGIFGNINGAGHKVVVLSCEFFEGMTEKHLRKLKRAIGVPDIEVVYVVRRWSDRIHSLWGQAVRTGGAENFPEFYLDLLNSKLANTEIDYSLAWDKLAGVFGRENLRLLPYSSVVESREDIFVYFCREILRITEIPKPKLLGKKTHKSLKPEENELLRMINTLYHREHAKKSNNLLFPTRRVVTRDQTHLFNDAMQYAISTLMIDDGAAVFDGVYARMMQYADRQTGAYAGADFFTRKQSAATYIQPSFVLEPGVADTLREVYAQVSRIVADTARKGKRKGTAPPAMEELVMEEDELEPDEDEEDAEAD